MGFVVQGPIGMPRLESQKNQIKNEKNRCKNRLVGSD